MQRITQIETEDDYREALKRFMEICESQKTDEDIEEMFLLIDIMEKYERANCGASWMINYSLFGYLVGKILFADKNK